MEFSKSCDFSLGKRVHGCLNTIQSGTFGVLIAHDERTLELAKTIGLPYIHIDSIETDMHLNSIINESHFDGANYDLKRRELFKAYNDIYVKAGVTNTNQLTAQYG